MDSERTILFADICDSTGMTERLGDVASRRQIGEILDLLASITRDVGGDVVKTIGDEIMSAFESPDDGIRAARDMQTAVTMRPPLEGIPTRIRIGLHGGPVILDGGDLFGDVVNVAARVAGLAAADQILTTRDTIGRVAARDTLGQHRSLGVHGVRGRDEPLTLVEVIWRDKGTQMTILAPRVESGPTRELTVTMGDQSRSLESHSTSSMSLGRGSDSMLVVPSSSASREHAHIHCRGGLFYLEDHSTNGTYLRPDDAGEIYVHRNHALLQGSGMIRLGEPISESSPLDIRYRTGPKE